SRSSAREIHDGTRACVHTHWTAGEDLSLTRRAYRVQRDAEDREITILRAVLCLLPGARPLSRSLSRRDFGACLPWHGERDRDRLLPARHLAGLAASAAAQCSRFHAAHRALDALSRGLSISPRALCLGRHALLLE